MPTKYRPSNRGWPSEFGNLFNGLERVPFPFLCISGGQQLMSANLDIWPDVLIGGTGQRKIEQEGCDIRHSAEEGEGEMGSVFSQIVNGELPSFRIQENERFLAFLDIRPVRPGHTLIVPKEEVDHFFDLDEELLQEILIFAKPVSQALKKVTGCERVAAVVAGFDVPHAHLHLIPAFSMSDLDLRQGNSTNPDALRDMAGKIRQAL
jgi:histidine triad (HIT) family protein